MTMGDALTWDELANLYDKAHPGSRPARTRTLEQVREWAIQQPEKFYLNEDNDGTIHLIKEKDMTESTERVTTDAPPPEEKQEVITNEEAKEEMQVAEPVTVKDLDIVQANPLQVELNAQFLETYNTLSTGKVPADAIEKRQGPAGLTFSYVPHWWVSRQLRIAFGPLWDFEVGEVEIFKDFSASAKVSLVVWIPMADGEFKETRVTCLGAFQGNKSMAHAYLKSSAVSRGLAKAAQLRFGIGEEFYAGEDEGIPDPTPKQAYAALLNYGGKKGLDEEEIRATLKGKVEYNDLGNQDTFLIAWGIIGQMIKDKVASEVVGDGEPEGF